jgi:hypothetical protein
MKSNRLSEAGFEMRIDHPLSRHPVRARLVSLASGPTIGNGKQRLPASWIGERASRGSSPAILWDDLWVRRGPPGNRLPGHRPHTFSVEARRPRQAARAVDGVGKETIRNEHPEGRLQLIQFERISTMKTPVIALALFFALGSTLALAQGGGGGGAGGGSGGGAGAGAGAGSGSGGSGAGAAGSGASGGSSGASSGASGMGSSSGAAAGGDAGSAGQMSPNKKK